MKLRKSLCSMLLLTVILGTTAPAVVSATDTTASSSQATIGSAQSVEDTTTTLEDTTSESSTTEVISEVPKDSTETTEITTSEPAETTTTEVSTTEEVTTEEVDPEADSATAALEKAGVLEGVIGKDGQYRVINTTVNPYRKTALVLMKFPNGQEGVGTGVMIGSDLVLTAAHLLYNSNYGGWAKSVTVAPAYDGKRAPYGTYSAKNYYMFRQFKTTTGTTSQDNDMGVIKLSRNVDSRVGYLSVSTSQTVGERIQLPGYPTRTASKAGYMYTMFDKITAKYGNNIRYTLDTEPGQSGGGVLNRNNQVIAINAYEYGSRNQVTGKWIQFYYNQARRVMGDSISMINIAKGGGTPTLSVTSYKTADKKYVTYRLYNSDVKRHIYTQSLDEASVLTTRGWGFEGQKFQTASTGKPVYRLYGKIMKEHIYTTDKNERDILVKTGNWNAEGTAWYSGGKTPVYRLYNPGVRVHLYTTDKNEVRVLQTRGWQNEGTAFYTK